MLSLHLNWFDWVPFRMSFKSASIMFWAVVVTLLGARVALHEQIALGTSPAGYVMAWLKTFIG